MIAALAAFYAQHSQLIDQIGINALLALSLSVSLQAGQLALAQAAFMADRGVRAAIASDAVSLAARRPAPRSRSSARRRWSRRCWRIRCDACAASFSAIATIGFGEIVRVLAEQPLDHRRRRRAQRHPQRRRTPGDLRRARRRRRIALSLPRTLEVRARGRADARGRSRGARRRRRRRHGALRSRSPSAARSPGSPARSTRTRPSSSPRATSAFRAWSRSWCGA